MPLIHVSKIQSIFSLKQLIIICVVYWCVKKHKVVYNRPNFEKQNAELFLVLDTSYLFW